MSNRYFATTGIIESDSARIILDGQIWHPPIGKSFGSSYQGESTLNIETGRGAEAKTQRLRFIVADGPHWLEVTEDCYRMIERRCSEFDAKHGSNLSGECLKTETTTP